MRPPRASTWAAMALIAAFGGATALAAWRAAVDPGTAFLASCGEARWILYPTPSDASARPLVEMATTFRRELVLSAVPRQATMRFRAFRRAMARVNGQPVATSETGGSDWKDAREAEVAPLLREGANRLEVVVVNAAGPPALWLELHGPGLVLSTDGSWDTSLAGAAWRKAALAPEGPRGRRFDPGGRLMPPLRALRLRWPILLSFFVVSVALAYLALRFARRAPASPPEGASPWPLRAALLVVAILWAALFVHDLPAIPLQLGFDAPQHLEYVHYVMQRHALPLADEGWQMFQPPLYYVLAAATLGVAGLEIGSPGNVVALRLLGLAVGLAHLLLIGALVQRVFRSAMQQVAGVVVAAMLPCMLVLHQFPTNEILVAMLSSAVALAAWVLAQAQRPAPRWAVLVGVLLGLALLAKFSALLLVPAVLGVVVARAVRTPRGRLAPRLAEGALVAAAVLATCGWHFARVWARFGTPLVGGWEARPGMGWWLDPGYRTVQHFLRFGSVLESPLFAGFHGFWDGLYSTLWGDGMLSGLTSTAPLPPWWSPSLHSAGYLLALLPTAAIVIGAAATTWEWIRRPSAYAGFLVGLSGLVLAALLAMSMRVPSVAEDKASYGLIALAPLCIFAGRGVAVLAGVAVWRQAALLGVLGVWAANSYAALWVNPASEAARLTKAITLLGTGDTRGGVEILSAAVRADPAAWGARVALARVLAENAGPPGDIEALLRPGDSAPARADRQLALALWADRRNDLAAAAQAVHVAIALDPDDSESRALLARILESQRDLEGAIQAWREVLRITPHDRAAHTALALLYTTTGRAALAASHAGYATRLAR